MRNIIDMMWKNFSTLSNLESVIANMKVVPSFGTDLVLAAQWLLEAIEYCRENGIRLATLEDEEFLVSHYNSRTHFVGNLYHALFSKFLYGSHLGHFLEEIPDFREHLPLPLFSVLPFLSERNDIQTLSIIDLKKFIELGGFVDSVSEAKQLFGDRWQSWLDPR